VIVIGGAMRSAEDYLPLARALAKELTVHVVDRRGRGASGPQGTAYGIEKECEDIAAVQAQTEATRIFGHSYGGLAVLEAAKRLPELAQVAVYEPGVFVSNSMPTRWIPSYEQLLAAGDTRGAFACFVRGSGHAPRVLELMPLAYARVVLRIAIRAEQWQRMEPLLAANLAEHREVARLEGTISSYAAVTAHVLLLRGSRSPASSARAIQALAEVIPSSTASRPRIACTRSASP